MIEWSERNTFNPMNSLLKGLTYYENYLNILGWMDGKNELGPPIEASLDPTSACNNNCYYCSSNRYIKTNIKRWGRDYFEEVLCHLAQWGVKGLCWGGREATLNLRLAEANRMARTLGIETAIVTNGVNLSDDLIDALMLCKWIGVSVDTCDSEVYRRVRGTDDCSRVWANIDKICQKVSRHTTVGVRALVLPETIDTLVETTKLARDWGANFIHIRPVDLERQDLPKAQKLNLDMERIQAVFACCHELETPEFGVFTITHKYDETFHVVHRFNRCLASPLVVQICADKSLYICVDHRMNERFKIGNLKDWGTDKHRELIKSINPDEECSRCTWSVYQEIIEKVVLNDSMHRSFP